MWKLSSKFRPCRLNTASGGYGVECSDTRTLGYAKPRDIWQEKLAYDLALAVGVSVPEIRLAPVDGKLGIHAISIAYGSESHDLKMVRDTGQITPELKTYLARASGLLPFHAWLRTGDLKEEHMLVAIDEQGRYLGVAAIDFASAFGWGQPPDTPQAPNAQPQGLVENADSAVIQDTVLLIEAVTDQRIGELVDALPQDLLPHEQRPRITGGLVHRRPGVRAAMHARGWLP